ncbi:MAG: hypothetical protein AAB074_12660 [Planctomycetota bacterium]
MPSPRISPLAIAAAAFGALGAPLFPSLLGLAALAEIRESGGARRGARLARIGIGLGILWFILEGIAAAIYLARPEPLLRRLYRDRIAQGEASAPDGLARIAAQQESLRKDDLDGNGVQDYWTEDIAGLYRFQLARHGRPESMGIDVARADGAEATGAPPIPRDGYLFRTVVGVDSLTQFAATAYPRTHGEDGFLTFYIDQRGIVWKRDQGGRPADHRMVNPEAEGWVSAEAK